MHLCSQLHRRKKEIEDVQDPTPENDYENFNFDKDEMPLETNKNEEGITGVNFLTSFLKSIRKKPC